MQQEPSEGGDGRGGQGWLGWRSHGLGAATCTGVCGLASQGAGQEVLQVWGAGCGLFGLTLR